MVNASETRFCHARWCAAGRKTRMPTMVKAATPAQNDRNIFQKRVRIALVLFHLSGRGIDVPDPPDGLNPSLPRRLRAQFAAQLANVNVDAAIERRQLPPQNTCCNPL